MGQKRWGPIRAAGVAIVEKEAERLLQPGALGVTGHLAILERGDEGVLISTFSKKQFLKKCGGRISDGFGPDCGLDFHDHAQGAGELHLVRVTDGTGRKSEVYTFGRGTPMARVLKWTAHNVGRWGGRAKVVGGLWVTTATDLANTVLKTGKTFLKNELKGGKVKLKAVSGKTYTIVSNTTDGDVTVASDSKMRAHYDATLSSDKNYTIILENDKKLGLVIDQGSRDPANEFSVYFYLDGELVKSYPDASMDPDSDVYVVPLVNDDKDNDYFLVENLVEGNTVSPDLLPASEYGMIMSLTGTVLTKRLVNVSTSSLNNANPTVSVGATTDDMKFRDRIVVTMSSGSAGNAVSDHFGDLGAVTLAAVGTVAAYNQTANAGPYNLAENETVTLDTEADVLRTATFNEKVRASVLGDSGGGAPVWPVTFNAGNKTLSITVDGTAHPVVFAEASTSLLSAIEQINEQLIGVGAGAFDSGGQIFVGTDTNGATGSLTISGTGYVAAFGAAPTVTAGSGNVDDIDAVTKEEVVAVCHAAFNSGANGASVALNGGFPRITRNLLGTAGTGTIAGTARATIGFGVALAGAVDSAGDGTITPTNPHLPVFTLSNGSIALANGDVVTIDYLPLVPNAHKGAFLAPDQVNSPLKRFRLAENGIDTMTVYAGDMTKVGVDGTGTISTTGTALTGVSTLLLTEAEVGDLIAIDGQARRIEAIGGNTAATLSSGFSSNLSGASFRIIKRFMLMGILELGGGYDGVEDINDSHFTSLLDSGSSLFRLLKGQRKGLVKVGVPGVTSTNVQKAGIEFASSQNWQFRVEIPANLTTEDAAVDYLSNTIGRSEMAVSILPSYAYVNDLDRPGLNKQIPLTGAIHGREALYASQNGGYHIAAAGETVTLPRITKLLTESQLDMNEEVLNPAGLQLVKKLNGNFVIWGDRTLSPPGSEWQFKHHREQMSHYENVLQESFNWIIFAINDPITRGIAYSALRSFFLPEWQPKRALQGNSIEEAAAIKIDKDNNSSAVTAGGDMAAELTLWLADTTERFTITMSKRGIFDSKS